MNSVGRLPAEIFCGDFMPYVMGYGSILADCVRNLKEDMTFRYSQLPDAEYKLINVRRVQGFHRPRGGFMTDMYFSSTLNSEEVLALIDIGYEQFYKLLSFEHSAGYRLWEEYFALENKKIWFWLHEGQFGNERHEKMIKEVQSGYKADMSFFHKGASKFFNERFTDIFK